MVSLSVKKFGNKKEANQLRLAFSWLHWWSHSSKFVAEMALNSFVAMEIKAIKSTFFEWIHLSIIPIPQLLAVCS